ncbi:MAG: murein biosynthesis integral membrane protein MurJ [Deltaproteobacteria bacterium]|nr:murein biosynthesis integral membrane protein MurJ [Deltaproteobacteria bacterium]
MSIEKKEPALKPNTIQTDSCNQAGAICEIPSNISNLGSEIVVPAKSSLIKSATVVGLGTLLSRVAGLVRDQVTAFYFGAGPIADAFFVAFRIPNFLRRLLAEGALTPAFIPVFTQRMKDQGINGAAKLYKGTFGLLSLFLIILTIVGIIIAPLIVTAMAPGFRENPAQFELTVLLTRVLFPYILLMSLTALAMGALNSLGRFTIPALGPVALNIAMIIGAVILSPRLSTPIMGLAAGALLGGILQLAIQLPLLKKAGPFLGLTFRFKDPAIWRMIKLMIPAALGGAAYQISILLNTLLVSFLPKGSVSWLYYADRLMQFPLGIFSIALATAVLPALSRQSATGDHEGFRKTISGTVGLQFFITIPAMVGLIVMSKTLVELLFQRGNFDQISSVQTAKALWAYVLGLPFLSGVSLLARAFYSRANTKTPALIAAICLAIGLVASAILMFPLKHVGLALASSITSFLNFIWLAWLLRKRSDLAFRPMIKQCLSYIIWAIIMGAALWPLYAFSSSSTLERLGRILIGLILGPAIYFGLAFVFHCPHLAPFKSLISKLKRIIKR